MSIVFFRNDDVRDSLDESLVEITNLFIKNNIPITHAVEPANVTHEVVNWLIRIKEKYPNLIEIIQHGYSHKLKIQKKIGGKIKKGEFGGDQKYEEQYKYLKTGKKIMDEYFAELWFPAFTFPYGARNLESLKALNDLGFLVVNGSLDIGLMYNLFYGLGHLLNKEYLLGRKISWNLRNRFNNSLFQIDICISFIKKYIDEKYNADFYDLIKIQQLTNKFRANLNNIGILLHHRYHNNNEKIILVSDYIKWLKKNNNITFATQKSIYEKYNS